MSFLKKYEKICDYNFYIFLAKNKIKGNIMETFGNKFCQNSAPRFYCKNCDYGTSKKSSYNDHLLSTKHKNTTNGNNVATNLDNNSAKFCSILPTKLTCEKCDKEFQTRSGLWKHRKNCINTFQHKPPSQHDDYISNSQMEFFTEIVKTTIIEVMKNGMVTNNNNSHNTTNNSHNKTFNLSFYLNETCKDAINIGDFVKSIKVQLEDLEHTGRVGYVDGVSDLIIDNLNSIDTHKRPIHCTDEKREVLYIKNDGEWIKEADNKPILTNAIKSIANENIKAISKWRKTYPDCTDIDSKKNNLYLKIVCNSMSGGSTEECEKNYNKIIRNIVKETIIDKDSC